MNTLATRVVVVGGYGSEGLTQLVSALPTDCGLTVVAVIRDEHHVAERLRSQVKLAVASIEQGRVLERDTVYVVPGDRDVVIREGRFAVTPATLPGLQLDRLTRSLADDLGRHSCVVILAGPGTDGVIGAKRIKEAGGLVLVGPVPDGLLGEMPRAAIATGVVDQVTSIEMIAQQLCRPAQAPAEDDRSDGQSDGLRDILTLVRIRSGHDFSGYKRATLYRRVARRMQVCQRDTVDEYLASLRDNPSELSHLLRDFLISVTNFFRDPDAYDAVSTQVLPRLFHDRRETIRVWVAGCATGEEAYSLGMLLLEHAERHQAPRIQVFATDIDEQSLAEARIGRYPDAIAVDVSPARLARFFIREAGYYRVNQELRELVLFSPHNVLRDPPFSRLDLVSCRNLLIYLNREAQNRVFSVFHFGLRPEGCLFLGASESAENSAMFVPIDPKARIFGRRQAPTTFPMEPAEPSARWQLPPISTPAPHPERIGSVGELHHRLAERYAPPSILVNGDMEIVHVSEHANGYLEVAPGEPTRHVLRLVHPALRLGLRSAIYTARQASPKNDTRRVAFDDDGRRRVVEMRVRGVEGPELGPNWVLVYFDEVGEDDAPRVTAPGDAVMEPVVREIEDELARTRDQLRTTIEQYETSVEELKASNEELQAINEEMRSASEELETSKEELQSVNEELTTLNHELKGKIDEVSHANSDLQNLMSSTDIGVVFLDRQFNITRFTPRAVDLFNLIPSDVGRPLADLAHRLDTDDLTELATLVLQQLRTIERDVISRAGKRYLIRLLPYRSIEDRIDGVVITFVDVSDLREAIDARRRTEAALQTSEARLRVSLLGAPLVVFSLDNQLHVTWGYAVGEPLPTGPLRIVVPYHLPRVQQLVAGVLASGKAERGELDFEIRGDVRTYEVMFERTSASEITAVGLDISSSKEAGAVLIEADRRKDEFLATLSHELRNPLTPLKVALDLARTTGDPSKLASSHQIMDRQLQMLTKLVDELLDLSRITQGKIELAKESVEPIAIVEAALEATRPLIEEAKHELFVDAPRTTARVLGDPGRLAQILINLLTNAAKYTPTGGRISLAAHVDTARHVAVFVVRDNGVGLSSDMLPRVFEIFVQSRDHLGRSKNGLGIGLALVKRLTELHGGKVSAHSDGKTGSEFVVELPLIR